MLCDRGGVWVIMPGAFAAMVTTNYLYVWLTLMSLGVTVFGFGEHCLVLFDVPTAALRLSDSKWSTAAVSVPRRPTATISVTQCTTTMPLSQWPDSPLLLSQWPDSPLLLSQWPDSPLLLSQWSGGRLLMCHDSLMTVKSVVASNCCAVPC